MISESLDVFSPHMHLIRLNSFQLKLQTRRLGVLLLRVGLLAWFAIVSLGLPLLLSSGSTSSSSGGCALRPGQDCQCSVKKKLSGTCCCSRPSPETVSKTSIESSNTEVSESQASSSNEQPKPESKSCCSKKRSPRVVASFQSEQLATAKCDQQVADSSQMVATDHCSCSGESDFDSSSFSQLALPPEATYSVPITARAARMTASFTRLPTLRDEPAEHPPRA